MTEPRRCQYTDRLGRPCTRELTARTTGNYCREHVYYDPARPKPKRQAAVRW